MGSLLDKVRRLRQERLLMIGEEHRLTQTNTSTSQKQAPRCETSELSEISPYRDSPGLGSSQFASAFPEASLWPLADASDLLARWEELDCPEIPLSSGVSISNLPKWLDVTRSSEDLVAVRRFLWEGLPFADVPKADPLLEEWRRVSIPQWRRILEESIAQGDSRREEYARWMLQDILLDPEYEEQDQ